MSYEMAEALIDKLDSLYVENADLRSECERLIVTVAQLREENLRLHLTLNEIASLPN